MVDIDVADPTRCYDAKREEHHSFRTSTLTHITQHSMKGRALKWVIVHELLGAKNIELLMTIYTKLKGTLNMG